MELQAVEADDIEDVPKRRLFGSSSGEGSGHALPVFDVGCTDGDELVVANLDRDDARGLPPKGLGDGGGVSQHSGGVMGT